MKTVLNIALKVKENLMAFILFVPNEILKLSLLRQPRWFQPLLTKSCDLQRLIGYDHWSWRWEYPWAISVAAFDGPCRVIDVVAKEDLSFYRLPG